MFLPEANTEISLGASFSATVLSDHLINFSRSHVTFVNISSQRFIHVGGLFLITHFMSYIVLKDLT